MSKNGKRQEKGGKMIGFIIGFCTGVFMGVFIMALMVAAGRSDHE